MTALSSDAPSFEFPMARFMGPEAAALADHYNGASRLANFAVQKALEMRPHMKVQAVEWARLGKFRLAAQFLGPQLGSLGVELHTVQHGNRAVLSTVCIAPNGAQQHWEADWIRDQRENEGFSLCTVMHQSGRGTEVYNYTGDPMEVSEPVGGVRLAQLSGVAIRAAETFGRYAGLLETGTKQTISSPEHLVYLSMLRFPAEHKVLTVPGAPPGHGSV